MKIMNYEVNSLVVLDRQEIPIQETSYSNSYSWSIYQPKTMIILQE